MEAQRSRWSRIWLLALGLATALPASADVRLPAVFGSHMVLQQEKPLPVWGWAEPGEQVTVEFRGERRQTTATPQGEWRLTLPAAAAGGPFTMTVRGANTIALEDVLVGEVWLASGQSNMEWGVQVSDNAEEEIAAANHPNIRLFFVPKKFTALPQDDVEAEWKVCTPETIVQGGYGGFSAVAYFFGRKLQQELGVPIGLIESAWGGTRIEPWTPPEGFAAVPQLADIHQQALLRDPRSEPHKLRLQEALREVERWLGQARRALRNEEVVPPMPTYPTELLPPQDQQTPVSLYNGMIHPVVPFAIRGAIWYQGESNHNEGMLYTEKMKALIGGWRQVWGQGDFPFYYVQVAPWPYGEEAPWILPEFWEAQAAALEIPNTGMAVVHDIGDINDIHPRNKQDVGLRLALWALAKTYGREGLVYSGPMYRSMRIEGNRIRISFEHVGGGLAARDGEPLSWFEVIDAEEGGFVEAKAEIDGDTVLVSAPGVDHPVAVRFAWHKLAEPNLMNREGLPAVPFRAGEVPERDLLEMSVAEAKDYRLVYDLDLKQLSGTIEYQANHSGEITQPFDRIAYFIELQTGDGNTQYLYVSMDAFTDDLKKIGVPTPASGAFFQQNVANLNVVSNVNGIATGTGLAGGNIEFWPHNYGPTNGASVPNASASVYDFGDQSGDPQDGYGCLQVHNHEARQTLFAVNNWKAGAGADLGIGNRPSEHTDWTFAGNANTYTSARLRVLVRPR